MEQNENVVSKFYIRAFEIQKNSREKINRCHGLKLPNRPNPQAYIMVIKIIAYIKKRLYRTFEFKACEG